MREEVSGLVRHRRSSSARWVSALEAANMNSRLFLIQNDRSTLIGNATVCTAFLRPQTSLHMMLLAWIFTAVPCSK